MKRVASYLFIMVLLITCASCGAPNFRIKKYYQDESHFKEFKANVKGYYDYWGDSNMIHLYIGDTGDDFSSSSIYLIGENANAARKNQIWNVIRMDSEITFVTSEAIFYDGYMLPIVSLSCQGEELLDYDLGRQNLIESFTFGHAKPNAESVPASAQNDDLLNSLGTEENPDGSCRAEGILCGSGASNQNTLYDLVFIINKSFSINSGLEYFYLKGDALEIATEKGFFDQSHMGDVFSLSATKDAQGDWILDSLIGNGVDYLDPIG